MNSYIGFNPKVILDIINSKLKDSGIFTGQDYSGSNFTALNDSLAWVVSMLLFYLNRTSSNTTLDTSDYNSINRISNIHGYKPRGSITASAQLTLDTANLSTGTHLISRYSKVGRYSVLSDFVVSGNAGILLDEITVYEGNVIQHPSLYSKGNSFEKLVINAPQFVDHNFLHVYVKETSSGKWYQYTETDFVILKKSTDRVFEKRLNENKLYEISFGDGINGRKLVKDEEICVFYLKSSGRTGEVVANGINNTFHRFSSAKFNEILANISPNVASQTTTALLRGYNNSNSSKFVEPETSEQMKRNLPGWMNRRRGLVKKTDFQERVMEQFPGIVRDCKVLTNEEYVNSIMKYYYDLGILDPNSLDRPQLSQLFWADSCNYNNLYVFILPLTSSPSYAVPAQAKYIKQDLQDRCGTQEIIIADPIYLNMYVGRNYDIAGKIILERERNSFRSEQSMIDEAYRIITSNIGFSTMSLGPTIRTDVLASLLKSMDSVKNVYTEADGLTTPGVSLILINPDYVQDSRTISQSIQLNVPFVPHFTTGYNLKNNIVVRESDQILRRPVF